jgi:3,4-dihydroxy 2-butanone 4-phosphate synthase/GTP cyclohydrolase II
MARIPDLLKFSRKHNLKVCNIASLIEYRCKKDKLIERICATDLPTVYGKFKLFLYRSIIDNSQHLVLVKGRHQKQEDSVLVRVHSQCLTGEVFGSQRCDCGVQLKRALEMISRQDKGMLLYMSQEGRGIGLANKLRCYALQDRGMDTVEANQALGFKPDLRDYGIGAQILVDLGVKNIRLLTNNPRKIVGLEGYGLKIVERIPLEIKAHSLNWKYLKTKKEKLGHFLDI